MKIVEIRDQVVSIRSEIRNSFIDFSEMTVSAVAIITDVLRDGQPVIGYGFNSNGRYAQSGILRERIIPRILKASPKSVLSDDGQNLDPAKIWRIVMTNEKPGGHGERSVAVGTLDMAIWDAVAKIERKPLYQLLAERYGNNTADREVRVYAAGGYYYPGKGIPALQKEIRGYLDLGYQDVKIKIGGASLEEDLRRIEATLEIVGEGRHLGVDANGRLDKENALHYAEALNPLDLKWYEEPGDPLDFELLAEVAKVSKIPIATGENLFSIQDSNNLIRYGGLSPHRDILQMDPALGYGLTEYLRILDMLHQHDWPWKQCVPHGGHQFALHIAAGLGLGGNESYPGVFQPFGGFADNVPVEQSRVKIPETPGIGIELKSELMKVYLDLVA